VGRPLVGESHYQDTLQILYRTNSGCLPRHQGERRVSPENDNVFDLNAVRVEIDSRRVGYLTREMALEYQAALGERSGQSSTKISWRL
jgi:hypothetical protein